MGRSIVGAMAAFMVLGAAAAQAADDHSVFGGVTWQSFPDQAPAAAAGAPVFEGPVPRAHCGRGSLPETGLQGQVPLADRGSGRSRKGYRCNLELVGRYQGEGASWVSQSYGKCAYMSTHFPSTASSPGVQVLDVSDARHPRLTGTLTSPAVRGPWESLKVNAKRGLLAGVLASNPAAEGVGFFDVYDIKADCRKPRLLDSVSVAGMNGAGLTVPANAIGHEGDWSPDGRTYWSASAQGGVITAIDVTDPTNPKLLYTGRTGTTAHGFGISDDGNRLYLAQAGNVAQAQTGAGLGAVEGALDPNGLQIFDVSQVQSRTPNPQIAEVGHVHWTDGAGGQHAIPITYAGRPYLVFVDELGQGAARIIDISDERAPRIVSKLKLQIHMPQFASERAADTQNTGVFGYEGHYCDVDRQADPTALACGFFQSGVRVFDIRHPVAPREIAYFNPPAQTGKNARLPSSEHATAAAASTTSNGSANLTADWCSSPPRFVGRQLWVTCQDNGFMALRFTNGAWPFRPPARPGSR
jgi:hypothetical protein